MALPGFADRTMCAISAGSRDANLGGGAACFQRRPLRIRVDPLLITGHCRETVNTFLINGKPFANINGAMHLLL